MPPIDYSRYPKNWKTEIRPTILKRANNCCEFCGVPNKKIIFRGKVNGVDVYQDDDGMIYDATNSKKIGEGYVCDIDDCGNQIQIVLTIAHLDHDEENKNVSLDRLKALCQRCHLLYDVNEKKQRRKNKQSPSLF